MNRVKVLKAIKGLQVGDILTYDDTTNTFVLNKVDQDISENTTSIKTLSIFIDRWVIESSLDYFTYIDGEGNNISVQRIQYEDLHPEAMKKEVTPTTKSVVYWRIRSPFESILHWI